MTVHRKSNWYVYLLAFGITAVFVVMAIMAFKWYLFPDNTQEVGAGNNGELTEDFRPTSEHNFNVMAMLSDSPNDAPDLFMLIEYNAVDSRLIYVPIPAGISVGKEERTLPNIYAAQGGAGVVKAVESVIGVPCDCFIKMDRSSFCDLITAFGNVEYSVKKTIIVKDGTESETFNAGARLITGESVFRLMMIADFEEGESFRFNCVGELMSELINQNFRDVNTSLMDTYYQMIIDNAETNLTEILYRSRKAALLNTIEYGSNPGEFYIPYGEYTEDGGFAISENSVISIRQRAGLE
ncbi:MAG: LCP family protein [Lachnospiraceae bacterium]|nr:LCP family protein [Ruminococcus sp.]MCM1274554.1 LCP family protein [Lachnospiraceae bacterium]